MKLPLAIIAGVVAFDQAIKHWVVVIFNLPAKGWVEVTPFFNLAMAWNKGVSFGLFPQETDLTRWLLISFISAVTIGLAVWLRRAEGIWLKLALAFIIGGSIGNLIDRFRWGAVADFLDFHAFGWHFWTFNIADSAISIGVILLLIDGLRSEGQTS